MSKTPLTKKTTKGSKNLISTPQEMQSIIDSYYQDTDVIFLEKAEAFRQKYPNESFGWEFSGLAYEKIGNLDIALQHTKRAAQLSPNDAEIQTNLGNLFRKSNRLDLAQACYKKAIKIKPKLLQAKNSLALVLDEQKFHAQAEVYFREIIKIDPDYISAYLNLSICLQSQQKNIQAEEILNQCITLWPNNAKAYHNLGFVLQKQGKLEQAELAYQKAIKLDENQSSSYCSLAALKMHYGEFDKAKIYAKKALSLNPVCSESYNNLGNALKETGKLLEAKSCFEKALEINPQSALSFNNLGNLLHQIGEYENACSCFENALSLSDFYPEAYSNLLFAQNFIVTDKRTHTAKSYGDYLKKHTKFKFENYHSKNELIRVGFVSGDFRNHSVSRFLLELIPNIQQQPFELFAYSNYFIEDEVTERLKPFFTEWRSIFGIVDEEAAQLIHNDKIDILIDLSGHTGLNRLPIFSYKPAPIQISWLGYFASTGLEEIDYILVDEIGVPKEKQIEFTEKLYYLPETRLCFSKPDNAPPISNLPCLNSDRFTFGCFQHLSKVNSDVLNTWAEILAKNSNAYLRWQCMQFNDFDLVEKTKNWLEEIGIDLDRVILLPSVSRETYLASYSEVDLVLDTFPYTGGTTTCEALWMGVPTLTIAGNDLLSRQGASLLSSVGLKSFIVNSQEEYILKSNQISRNPLELTMSRTNIREKLIHSPLFNSQKFSENFCKALLEIFDNK